MDSQTLQPPMFGSYALLRPIAEGSSAGVYLAASLAEGSSRRLCVLKKKRVIEEMPRSLAPVAIENLVTTVDGGQVTDERFVVVELIDGRDLLSVWNRSAELRLALPEGLAVAAVVSILDALSQVHERGMLYGQLCPSKVLLAPDGVVKLAEFQLAQTVRRADDLLRPGYIAPERVNGEGVVDLHADLFAAGIILWELLIQRPLFSVRPVVDAPGDSSPAIIEKMRGALLEYDLALSEVERRAPPGLAAVVARALARDPSARFRSAAEFRAALDPFVAARAERCALIARVLTATFGSEVGLGDYDHGGLLASAAATARSMTQDRPPAPSKGRPTRRAGRAVLALTAGAGVVAALWFGPRLARRAPPATAHVVPSAPLVVPIAIQKQALPTVAPSAAAPHTGEASPALARENRAPASVMTAPEAAPPIEASVHTPVAVSAETVRSPPDKAARKPSRARTQQPQPEPQLVTASADAAPAADTRGAPHTSTRHRGHTRDAASAADLLAQGNAAFEKGDLDRSLSLAIKAAKSGGGEDAYLLAGDSALKKGKRAQAEHAYKVALKLNPSSRAAQRGLQLLREMSTGEPPQTDPDYP